MALMVSFSIKDVPDDLAQALRDRASRNHRSLQGELMHILETALRPRSFRAEELVKQLKAIGVSTPADAVKIVRRQRDRR